jgi:hypothetical protein
LNDDVCASPHGIDRRPRPIVALNPTEVRDREALSAKSLDVAAFVLVTTLAQDVGKRIDRRRLI